MKELGRSSKDGTMKDDKMENAVKIPNTTCTSAFSRRMKELRTQGEDEAQGPSLGMSDEPGVSLVSRLSLGNWANKLAETKKRPQSQRQRSPRKYRKYRSHFFAPRCDSQVVSRCPVVLSLLRPSPSSSSSVWGTSSSLHSPLLLGIPCYRALFVRYLRSPAVRMIVRHPLLLLSCNTTILVSS